MAGKSKGGKLAGLRKALFFRVALALYILVMGVAIVRGVTHPVLNWDMLGYAGSILSRDTSDPAEIHARMLAEIKPVVWPALYEEYSQKNPLSADAGNFYRQIPFYDIKPLYVAAVWLLHALGAGLAKATWLVSAISFAGIAVILALWLPEKANRGAWLLSVAALTLLGRLPMSSLAAYSTPDALSLVFLMGGFIGWLRLGSVPLYMAGALLSILARPDALLQVLALSFYLTFFAAPEKRQSYAVGGAVALCSLAVYFAIQLATHSAGWQVLFYRGFINDNYDFSRGDATITLRQYLAALWWGIEHMAVNPRFVFFALLSAAAFACHWVRPAGQRQYVWMLLMAWGTFAVRFMLFPNWGDERYYYYFYLIMIMASLELASPLLSSLRLEPAEQPRRRK